MNWYLVSLIFIARLSEVESKTIKKAINIKNTLNPNEIIPNKKEQL